MGAGFIRFLGNQTCSFITIGLGFCKFIALFARLKARWKFAILPSGGSPAAENKANDPKPKFIRPVVRSGGRWVDLGDAWLHRSRRAMGRGGQPRSPGQSSAVIFRYCKKNHAGSGEHLDHGATLTAQRLQ